MKNSFKWKVPKRKKKISVDTRKYLLIGSILLGLSFILYFALRPLSIFDQSMIYVPFALGISFFASLLPYAANVELQFDNYKFLGASSVAIFLALLYFKPLLMIDNRFSLKVYVHGNKGKQDMVLKAKGYVTIDLDGERFLPARINEQGVALFENIAPSFINKTFLITVDAPTYQVAHPDSFYIMRPYKNIYVELTRKGLNKAIGYVFDENNHPIKGASVSIGKLPEIYTANNGYFELKIPLELQKEEQTIIVTKDGYYSWEELTSVDTAQELKIILKKTK